MNSYPTRYVRRADGSESWTYRTTRWDSELRNETVAVAREYTMKARNDWPCKFDGCGDRTVIAGQTEIVKRGGKWGHVNCPAAPVVDDQEIDSLTVDLALAEYNAVQSESAFSAIIEDEQDDVDAALAAFDQARRAANLKNLKPGTYRVEFSGRADTDSYNLKITADARYDGAFRFKSAESYDGVGRIFADGRIQIWDSAADPHIVSAARKALDVLLVADQMGKYGEAYARSTGSCWRCNRELKVEDSIDRGLGKVCSLKVEAAY